MKRTRHEVSLVAGAAIFFSAFLLGDAFGVSSATSVSAAVKPKPQNEKITLPPDTAKDTEMIRGLKNDLSQVEEAFSRLSDDYDLLKTQLTEGYVEYRTVTVTEADTVHTLVEPKLMLATGALIGGSVHAVFGTTSHWFAVGERFDFRLDTCRCFLLLLESGRGYATFRFGCEHDQSVANP